MISLLNSARRNAKSGGYVSPQVSASKLLEIWNHQNGCIMCHGAIGLLKAHLHHNHETGEFEGFAHESCNLVEGHLRKLSSTRLVSFCRYIMKGVKPWQKNKA
jgi:hypothetical protein